MIEPPSTSGFVARTTPSARIGSGALKTSSDGRFGRCDDAVDRLEARGQEASRSAAARRCRSVPGPTKRSASKWRSVTRAGGADERVGALAPRGDRVVRRRGGRRGRSASQSCAHAASGSRSGCTSCAHGRRRARHRRPVRRALVDDLAGLAHRRAAGRGRPAPGRGRRTARGAPGRSGRSRAAALAPELQDPLAVPRRHEVERVVVGVLQARALDVQVEVGDVDELGPVRGRRWRPARGSAPPCRSRSRSQRAGRAGRSPPKPTTRSAKRSTAPDRRTRRAVCGHRPDLSAGTRARQRAFRGVDDVEDASRPEISSTRPTAEVVSGRRRRVSASTVLRRRPGGRRR